MQRVQTVSKTLAAAACVGSLLLAQAAHASGASLEIFPDPKLLACLVVLFLLLVVPLNQLIFKPLFRVLDERDERITGTRQRAERIFREADATLARYEKAVQETREEAEGERRAQLDRARGEMLERMGGARAEAKREVERARGELASTLDAARGTLRTESRALAREAAARVLGRAV